MSEVRRLIARGISEPANVRALGRQLAWRLPWPCSRRCWACWRTFLIRAGQGQLSKLPHVLLFPILAIVTGCTSYRGVERRRSPDIVAFIAVHRRRLDVAFGLNWRRAPARAAVRHVLQGLGPAGVERAVRRHAALPRAARATPGQGSIALDGETLRGSVEPRGSPDIAEKSNEIPAAQALLAELGVARDTLITPDALRRQKNTLPSRHKPTPP